MGNTVSYLVNLISSSSPDASPDPATGLSERDKTLIRSSWTVVGDRKNLKENGVEMFIQLFQKFPRLQEAPFKDMSPEELRKNPTMRAHATSFMFMVTSYVENLDDTDTLFALLQKICNAHVKRNIAEQDFLDLASMFVSYLRSITGTQITMETEEAWDKLLTLQNGVYKKTLDAFETGM